MPDTIEEVKWRKPTNPLGVPTWSHAGIICSGESYKEKVKLTFAKGSSLSDPAGLFNASLTGVRRALIRSVGGVAHRVATSARGIVKGDRLGLIITVQRTVA